MFTPATENTDLVVGAGRLYFDKYNVDPTTGLLTPTGEMYFGNSPEFTLTQALTKLDHYTSDSGQQQKDRTVSLRDDVTGKFSTDNIDVDNLGLWWLGSDSSGVTVAPAQSISEVIAFAMGNRQYQLGESDAQPSGARNIANVTVKFYATAVEAAEAGENIGADTGTGTAAVLNTDYQLDEQRGNIYIVPGGAIDAAAKASANNGVALAVQYDQLAATRDQVIASGAEIYGRLRFLADNQVGINRDCFLPYVKLTPQGDIALKGQTWQTLNFDLDVLKLPNREKFYMDGLPQ